MINIVIYFSFSWAMFDKHIGRYMILFFRFIYYGTYLYGRSVQWTVHWTFWVSWCWRSNQCIFQSEYSIPSSYSNFTFVIQNKNLPGWKIERSWSSETSNGTLQAPDTFALFIGLLNHQSVLYIISDQFPPSNELNHSIFNSSRKINLFYLKIYLCSLVFFD